MKKNETIFYCLLLGMIILSYGCIAGLNPPTPGSPGKTPIGQFWLASAESKYASPFDIFETNYSLFTISQDQFTSISPTSNVQFNVRVAYNSTKYPEVLTAPYPYNLIYKYGFVYLPQDTRCRDSQDGCNLGEEINGKCCLGWQAFRWSGQTVNVQSSGKLAAAADSIWINYSTDSYQVSVPASGLSDLPTKGPNFVIAYSCKRIGLGPTGQWKCGCVNPTNCGKWMLQMFNVTKITIPTATCTDNTQNQDETDVDCGGVCVVQGKKCADNQLCSVPGDCISDVCSGTPSKCQVPTCGDAKKNGLETGVDCGGTKCISENKKCDPGVNNCKTSADCKSSYCANINPTTLIGSCTACTSNANCPFGTCTVSTGICTTTGNCVDTIKNQDETDVDCGGSICSKCGVDKVCSFPADCLSYTCTGAPLKCANPIFTISSPLNNTVIYTSTLPLAFGLDKPGLGKKINISVDGLTQQEKIPATSTSYNLQGLTHGVHTILLELIGESDEKSLSPRVVQTLTVNVQLPPVIEITSPTGTTASSTSVSFQYTMTNSGGRKIKVTIGSGQPQLFAAAATGTISLNLAQGTNNIVFEAVKEDGTSLSPVYSITKAMTVTIDTPDLVITSIVYGQTQTNDLPIIFFVKNQGSIAPTVPVRLNYTVIDTSDNRILANGLFVEDWAATSLPPNSQVLSRTVSVTLGSTVNLKTIAQIDPLNTVAENNKVNNKMEESISLLPADATFS